MSLQAHPELVERLVELNTQAFGSTDDYSQPQYLEKFIKERKNTCLLHTYRKKIIGYYLLLHDRKALYGERLAVDEKYRNKKAGTKLIRKAFREAQRRRKPFITYTHRDNLGSLNLHLRLGMKLTKIKNNYLYLSTP